MTMSNNLEKDSLDIFMESYNNLYLQDLDKVNIEIDKILLFINSLGMEPKFVLNRALYENDKGIFEKGKFVIRPTVGYLIEGCEKKNYSFILVNDNYFFLNFIENIINWISEYNVNLNLYENLDKLNKFFEEILSDMQFPYNISFGIGNDIIDIDDESIILGIKKEILLEIDNLPFFSEDTFWKESYIEGIKNTLKECNRPYDIVKIKSKFTYDMGIYNRRSIYKLLRQIVKRNIKYVRIGVGYMENSDYFAVIEKKAVTVKELEEMDISNCIVEDNVSKTKIEEKDLKDKIVWSFKLNPFEKKTNLLYETELKEFLKLCEEEVEK